MNDAPQPVGPAGAPPPGQAHGAAPRVSLTLNGRPLPPEAVVAAGPMPQAIRDQMRAVAERRTRHTARSWFRSGR